MRNYENEFEKFIAAKEQKLGMAKGLLAALEQLQTAQDSNSVDQSMNAINTILNTANNLAILIVEELEEKKAA